MRKLVHYLKPYRKQCTIGPFCKLMEAILELLLPSVMAIVIDQGVAHNDLPFVFMLGGLMILMVFAGFGFSITCQYNAALASQGFGTNLRNIVFHHISQFSYEDIDYFSTSSLTNRLSNDINQLQVAVAMLIRLVIRSPFIVIGSLIITMFLDMRLALILLASVPVNALILYVYIRCSAPLYRYYQKKLDRFATILDDNFAGIRVIRAFVSQHKERVRFHEAADDLQKQMMKVSRLSSLLNPFTSLIVNGAIVVILYTGGWQIEIGGIQAGVIIAFINYATQILLALVATSNLIVIFTKASASAQRINEVLDHEPSMRQGRQAITPCGDMAVSFEQVSFSYGEGDAALSDISFMVKTNETIGVIGGTGSGKSTLAHLLCRFYDPDEGTIRLFHHPIEEYDAQSLAKAVCIVPQTNEVFHMSIRDNLTLGLADVAESDIRMALEDAQAMEFIQELPKGLDTMLERGGTNLSGGQKQRLCIARALLRKSAILILDDSCSALDFRTDAALRKALYARKQTKFIISQRVGTLMNCDRILVLNDGRIAGFDTHKQLYEHCAVYRELCESQAIGRDDYAES